MVEKIGRELTTETLLRLLIRFIGRAGGIEDSGAIGKRIESVAVDSVGLLSICTRRS